jgi:GT2 family glycosyltransferase
MWIDVRIPFDENNLLALAYNRALEEGSSEWVLFLDHDVFLCNPRWYEMCLKAIEIVERDPKAAMIGCECGGEHHKRSVAESGVPTDRLELYIDSSKNYYYQYGNSLQRIEEHVPGYFMLLRRDVAKKIGFQQRRRSINNIDVDFGQRLLKAGYHVYQMRGLYIYHRRGMKHLKKEFINIGDETES